MLRQASLYFPEKKEGKKPIFHAPLIKKNLVLTRNEKERERTSLKIKQRKITRNYILSLFLSLPLSLFTFPLKFQTVRQDQRTRVRERERERERRKRLLRSFQSITHFPHLSCIKDSEPGMPTFPGTISFPFFVAIRATFFFLFYRRKPG